MSFDSIMWKNKKRTFVDECNQNTIEYNKKEIRSPQKSASEDHKTFKEASAKIKTVTILQIL